MAELRAALGITQASFYAAYGSKEQLFREAIDLYRQTDGITTPRALNADLKARESIHAMLQDAVDVFTAPGALEGALLSLVRLIVPWATRTYRINTLSLRRETVKSIQDRLRRGQREADMPKRAPIAELAEYYATVLHGLSIQSTDGSSRKLLTHVVNCAMATWDQIIG